MDEEVGGVEEDVFVLRFSFLFIDRFRVLDEEALRVLDDIALVEARSGDLLGQIVAHVPQSLLAGLTDRIDRLQVLVRLERTVLEIHLAFFLVEKGLFV